MHEGIRKAVAPRRGNRACTRQPRTRRTPAWRLERWIGMQLNLPCTTAPRVGHRVTNCGNHIIALYALSQSVEFYLLIISEVSKLISE